MKTPSPVISNIRYYNQLIENKKVELAELIDIRDKLVKEFDQQKVAPNT